MASIYDLDECGSESRKRKWEDGSVLPNVTPSVSVAPLKSPDVPSTVTQGTRNPLAEQLNATALLKFMNL